MNDSLLERLAEAHSRSDMDTSDFVSELDVVELTELRDMLNNIQSSVDYQLQKR